MAELKIKSVEKIGAISSVTYQISVAFPQVMARLQVLIQLSDV